MADPQIAATVSPVPTGPVQPATPAADDGYERVSRDELTTLRRNSEKVRGMEGFYQESSRRGFKRPEDFGTFDKFNETLKGKGLTMDQMVQILQGQEEKAEKPAGGGMDPASIEKFLKDQGYMTKAEVDKTFSRRDALTAHQQALAKEGEYLKNKYGELLGENPTDYDKFLIENAARAHLDGKRSTYPEGHPLHQETLAAYDEKGLELVWGELKQMHAKSRGADLAAKGAAVNNGAKPIAGGGGSKQPPKPADKDDDDAPIGSPEHKRKVERYAASLASKRGQGPVSAAG